MCIKKGAAIQVTSEDGGPTIGKPSGIVVPDPLPFILFHKK